MEALKHSVEELSHLCEAGQISSQEMQCRRDAAISFYLGLPVDPKLLLAMHRPFSRARRSLPTTPPPCCRTNAKHCRLSAVQLSDRQHAVAAASGHIPMGVPEVTEPCAARAEAVAVAVAVDNTAEGAHHPRRSSRSSEDPSLPRKLEQQEQPASVTVQLGRLPVGATQAEVEGLLAGLPGLRSVRLVYRRDGFFSGKALAEFTDPAQASAARDHVVRSGATVNGHPIEVVLAKASGRLRSHSV